MSYLKRTELEEAQQSRRLGILLVVAGAVCWGFIGIFVQAIGPAIDPSSLSIMRLGVAGVWLMFQSWGINLSSGMVQGGRICPGRAHSYTYSKLAYIQKYAAGLADSRRHTDPPGRVFCVSTAKGKQVVKIGNYSNPVLFSYLPDRIKVIL